LVFFIGAAPVWPARVTLHHNSVVSGFRSGAARNLSPWMKLARC